MVGYTHPKRIPGVAGCGNDITIYHQQHNTARANEHERSNAYVISSLNPRHSRPRRLVSVCRLVGWTDTVWDRHAHTQREPPILYYTENLCPAAGSHLKDLFWHDFTLFHPSLSCSRSLPLRATSSGQKQQQQATSQLLQLKQSSSSSSSHINVSYSDNNSSNTHHDSRLRRSRSPI